MNGIFRFDIIYFIMKLKRHICKNFISWIIGLIISVVIINTLLFPIYHLSPWINTDYNATTAIFYPNSVIAYSEEGYGIRKVDRNGFVNPSTRLNYDNYILFMGASHTIGKEILQGYSFVDILEEKYGLKVYSIAMDGHYYPEIISGFSAAIQQFPNSNSIVIEISSTDYELTQLENSIVQREYNPQYSGANISNTFSPKDRVKIAYQDYFPLIRAINKNLKSNQSELSSNKTKHTTLDENYEKKYIKVINDTLSVINKNYTNPVYIVYHPEVSLSDSGEIEIIPSATKEQFKNCCEENNIFFIDMTEDFVIEFNNSNKLPYGFMNTSYGTGHLNRTGHQLIAEKIYSVMEEKR